MVDAVSMQPWIRSKKEDVVEYKGSGRAAVSD